MGVSAEVLMMSVLPGRLRMLPGRLRYPVDYDVLTGRLHKGASTNDFVGGPNSAGSCYVIYYHTLF